MKHWNVFGRDVLFLFCEKLTEVPWPACLYDDILDVWVLSAILITQNIWKLISKSKVKKSLKLRPAGVKFKLQIELATGNGQQGWQWHDSCPQTT